MKVNKNDTYSVPQSWLPLLLCHCPTLPLVQLHTLLASHLEHVTMWFRSVALMNNWWAIKISLAEQKTPVSHCVQKYLPMLVAPASTLFSTSSLTAVAKVRTTCPEQIWCTECLSMALMALAGSEQLRRKVTMMYNFIFCGIHIWATDLIVGIQIYLTPILLKIYHL